MSNVGYSYNRTPLKHDLLNATSGRVVSATPWVAANFRMPCESIFLIDLTAGDGISHRDGWPWWRGCSPGLLTHHGRHQTRAPIGPKPTWIWLFERDPTTYQTLRESLALHLPNMGYERVELERLKNAQELRIDELWQGAPMARVVTCQMDSRAFDFSRFKKGDWLFVVNDPNTIHDWALSHESVLTAVNQGAIVQIFSTMGCNVGGLHRLMWENGRDIWPGYMEGIEDIVCARRTLDAILIVLEKDSSQWAYLFTVPHKWRAEAIAEAQQISKKYEIGIQAFSYLYDQNAYRAAKDKLVRTAKELAELEGKQMKLGNFEEA